MVSVPWRVFNLDSVNVRDLTCQRDDILSKDAAQFDSARVGMDRRRSALTLAGLAKGSSRRLAQTNVPRLSTLLKTLECRDTLFQWGIRVDSVQIV